MNLQIAVVISCTDTGCRVYPISVGTTIGTIAGTTVETLYSEAIRKYNIPIHPDQFVIVDNDTVPPETIFRWGRGTITRSDRTETTWNLRSGVSACLPDIPVHWRWRCRSATKW